MRYHKSRHNHDKWTKHTGWDIFHYEKVGKKYYDILPSLYYTNQVYGALNKCWLGFTIAKNKQEEDKIKLYALRIQKLERQLGLRITDFSNWGIVNFNKNNYNFLLSNYLFISIP